MLIEFLSIVVFTFALSLVMLGVVTWWIERGHKRALGGIMIASGVLIAAIYAFLGSRFSIALFGRLIVTVDLPRLMATAIVYTVSVLLGLALAGGAFLWISGQLIRPSRFERQIGTFLLAVLLIALAISLIAIQLSH